MNKARLTIFKIRTLLPASEEAFDTISEAPSVTLHQALRLDATNLSEFACRVVSMHLFHECFHIEADDEDDSLFTDLDDEHNIVSFDQRFHRLDAKLTSVLTRLPHGLQCPPNNHNIHAIIINLQLYTATICLHRTAWHRATRKGIVQPDIEEKVVAAAQAIAIIVATVVDIEARFRNPFIAFAAFMAAFVFLKQYLAHNDVRDRERLEGLLNVMVSIGVKNPVTASLAVQLAGELQRTGVDPIAMSKVCTSTGMVLKA